MAIQEAFEKQGFSVGWRGHEPVTSAEITLDYLTEDVGGLPRANMAEKDNLDGLDLDQLKLDYDDELNADQEIIDRKSKSEEIIAEAMARIHAHLTQVESLDDVLMLKKLAGAFVLSVDGESAKDIHLYAKTKMTQAATAPIDDVRTYDPATDPNWP